jgi:predicted membrane-bound spermidine synthase
MLRLSLGFFLSGFAALLCQVAWQRMLGILAGSDTVSAALVVGAFLAGLGLGALVGARVADRLTPGAALLGFVAAEVLVAVFALLSKPFLYDLLALRLAGAVDSQALIFALCFAGLVLPTTLMGMSLPLVARAVATRLDTAAERIGWLYGLNTLGAGIGALVGGWVLLGRLGFDGALGVAAMLNLLAASLALSLRPALRLGSGLAAAGRAMGAAPVQAAPGSAVPGGLPLWALLVFLSGYVIVALEIVWLRVLGQAAQFHAYLFPTLLGVFLLADGLGMAVGARWLRRIADPRPAFFLAQSGGFVLAAALLLALWWALPLWPLGGMLMPDQWRFGGRGFWAGLGLVVVVVAPPAFLIGMTFPFVQRAVQRDLAQVGARTGWVQLANIAGNAAGSLLTGLVTLHLLGTAGTLALLALISLALALFWLVWASGGARAGAAMAAAGCAAVLLALPGNAAFWQRAHGLMAGGAHAWGEDRSGIAFWRAAPEQRPGKPDRDGPFYIAGYAQATIPFAPRHMALGAAGPLLHPTPRRVFLIGVGSAGSPFAAAMPGVEALRAVELVAPVLSALRDHAALHPDGAVAALLADPRIVLEAGDGRRALARSAPGSWDVIQADAVLPQTSQSGLLYSREYFALVRSRLAPGGLAVQWAPSWDVVETFRSVFPHVVMLRPADILIGSEQPIENARARLLVRLAEPAVAARLAQGNPGRAAEVAADFRGEALAWGPDAPHSIAALTDLHPRDEFFRNNTLRETWASPVPPALRAAAEPGALRAVLRPDVPPSAAR